MAPTSTTASAPVEAIANLAKRQYGYGGYTYNNCPYGYINNNGTCQYSAWSSWGRWILAVAVVIIFALLVACCGAFNARKRRARGMQPRYGTGWIPAGPAPKYTPGPNPAFNEPPPPGYSQQHQQQSGTTYGNGVQQQTHGEGYYGGGNHGNGGIELQQPSQAYARNGENVYAPPAGPPPGKK